MHKMCTVVLLMLVSTIGAVHVHDEVTTPFCERKSLHKALTNTVAYNVAFSWSKHADLKHWFFEHSSINGTNMKCVRYGYSTRIKLPGAFAQYVGSLLREIDINKHVCVVADKYIEDVRVGQTAIIDNLSAKTKTTLHDAKIQSSIDVTFDLPWYVSFLETSVSYHIMKSFKEKFVTLATILCEPD